MWVLCHGLFFFASSQPRDCVHASVFFSWFFVFRAGVQTAPLEIFPPRVLVPSQLSASVFAPYPFFRRGFSSSVLTDFLLLEFFFSRRKQSAPMDFQLGLLVLIFLPCLAPLGFFCPRPKSVLFPLSVLLQPACSAPVRFAFRLVARSWILRSRFFSAQFFRSPFFVSLQKFFPHQVSARQRNFLRLDLLSETDPSSGTLFRWFSLVIFVCCSAHAPVGLGSVPFVCVCKCSILSIMILLVSYLYLCVFSL
jgi:hypothetical protein